MKKREKKAEEGREESRVKGGGREREARTRGGSWRDEHNRQGDRASTNREEEGRRNKCQRESVYLDVTRGKGMGGRD